MNWWKNAACEGQPLELFFPGQGQSSKAKQAKAICNNCPVVEECLDYILQFEDPTARHGIFGGMNPDERRSKYGITDVQ